ncbi:MAG: 2,3-bisphosphoglycerate-independent phosphoglycerate mutase [Planctomycetota bacterium]
MSERPVVLVIRDGWGMNPNPDEAEFDAVLAARTPVSDGLMERYPWTLVKTCGEDVGLNDGTMGNSEVGHQNIGAGRIVDQDSVRITKACREETLGEVEALTAAIHAARDSGNAVHLMGLNSDAGVHAMLDHLFSLLDLCKEMGVERVFVHLFGDGRDTGPFTGKAYAERVEAKCREVANARVASVIGRYYAMDRDNRWERVARAYSMLTDGLGLPGFPTAADAFQAYYDEPDEGLKGDEFVSARTVGDAAESRIASGDAVIFFNYRGDRPRELCSAFLLPEFHGSEELKASPDSGERGFDRGELLDLRFVLMTPYSERLAGLAPVAFAKPPKMVNTAGQYLSAMGLRQFRCAETEKYPHVTFFFNDYRDEPFEGESRAIVQSPRVATYDLQPEMSARAVCDAVLGRLAADDCEDLIVVNFANGDMVGHTGSMDAAVKACEVVDALTGEIVDATLARGGSLVVTADHGNAERMFNRETSSPHTAHTLFDVPLIVVGSAYEGRSLRGDQNVSGYHDAPVRAARGRLADVLPTVFEMMGVSTPDEMTGSSLLV